MSSIRDDVSVISELDPTDASLADAQSYLEDVSVLDDDLEFDDGEAEQGKLDISHIENWPQPPGYILKEAVKTLGLPVTCSVCRKDGDPNDLLSCDGCGPRFIFHKRCWAEWAEHKPNRGLTMYEPCVKSEFRDWVWINWLLYSRVPRAQAEQMHIEDIWATWFAVPHYQNEYPPKLHLYPRMQHLVNMKRSNVARQFPSLIAFFGETGSGKSTLIRALIRNISPDTKAYPVPVPGDDSALDRIKSTSGDVHLYADPESLSTEVPLFYADCEGFRGTGLSVASRLVSEAAKPRSTSQRNTLQKPVSRDSVRSTRTPTSSRHRLASQGTTSSRQRAAGQDSSAARNRFVSAVAAHSASQKRTFELRWAQLRQPGTHGPAMELTAAESRELSHVASESRGLIVNELYPRLLYAFSDVVCFITNNPRATEKDILSLFEWARSGHERTLNQRIRPGLIIIVNKDSPNLQEEWFDVNYSTTAFLENFTFSSAFTELIEKWATRGKTLRTAKDLIECYYDSFRVVCIPGMKGTKTAQQIARQYRSLYREIRDSSTRLRAKKQEVDMKLDITTFNAYLERAFAKLAREYKASLDFYYLNEQDQPVPTSFREHLTATLDRLQTAARYGLSNDTGQETALVKRLTPYLACCIKAQIPQNVDQKRPCALLECDRLTELTGFTDKDEFLNTLLAEAGRGFVKFRDRHWRCEAKSRDGSKRCLNYWEGHVKGHQFPYEDSGNKKERRPSITVGEYQSSYNEIEIMDALERAVYNIKDAEHALASLPLVSKASGIAEICSNRTCLSCLSNAPTNILPCHPIQHSMCEDCLQRFDHRTDHRSAVILNQCPLGCHFESPWTIRLKPKNAGARILSLDGGGVRGILELYILDQLVEQVGHSIPIQELFDLVIGTSTGGIVALGIFKMDWSVKEARQKFIDLVNEAFSPRQILKVPVFRNAAQLFCSFRYKSTGIETALQKAFRTNTLFGQNEKALADRVKVGVVATASGGLQPCLFANYSRNLRGPDDPLQREDIIENDLTTWQAGRATSAAPIYFAPYVHDRTKRSYVDGALSRNNPIRVADDEWRLLWNDNTVRPDLVLSIGTGVQTGHSATAKSASKSKAGLIQSLIPRGLKKKFATGFDMIVATLDCSNEWKQYVTSKMQDPLFAARCHRLDVGLVDKPPKVDEVKEVGNLEREAQEYLGEHYYQYMDPLYKNAHEHIKVVARRLLASLFYFIKKAPQDGGGAHDDTKESGTLQCRLSPTMDVQFASLMASGPVFRVQEVFSGRTVNQDVVYVNRQQPWHHATFSSEICYRINSSAERRVIQVQFPRRSFVFENISGF